MLPLAWRRFGQGRAGSRNIASLARSACQNLSGAAELGVSRTQANGHLDGPLAVLLEWV